MYEGSPEVSMGEESNFKMDAVAVRTLFLQERSACVSEGDSGSR